MSADPPGRPGDHAQFAGVALVVRVDFRCESLGLHENSSPTEVFLHLPAVENGLLIGPFPSEFARRSIGHPNVDGHDARVFVEPRGSIVEDRTTVEFSLPPHGAPCTASVEVTLTDIVHDEYPRVGNRTNHAVGDPGQELRINDVAERVTEQDARAKSFVALPCSKVTDVEFHPRIVAMSPTGFVDALGGEIHPDDSSHTAIEQGSDVPTRAEAWEEHRPWNPADQPQNGVDFGVCERAIVMNVAIELFHDVVVTRDVELGWMLDLR